MQANSHTLLCFICCYLYRAVLKCISFLFRFPAIYALTTVILAVGEVDGELRSAVLEYTYEHINVALATCMRTAKFGLGPLQNRMDTFFSSCCASQLLQTI